MKGLEIVDFEAYKAAIKKAGANGSIESLSECIVSLTLANCRVRLFGNAESEMKIIWLNGDESVFMVGALVYHEASNEWSVHT